jgi:lysyl-tRNA synthetase, class I
MFWADEVAQKLKARNLPLEWVDDMKTPSGRVHSGALMGVVIHDLVYRALQDIGVKAKYTYVFENHDPMDDIPSYLPREKYEAYLGMPLYKIPSPEEGYANFAEYYAKEFQDAFNAIGSHPEILWTKDLYTSGKMNPGIKRVLDNAEKIREIYREMYNKDIAADWYPFQVYCENCGKVSTTRVYNWDGEKVWYRCPVDATEWTKGCGHEGAVSPFSDEHHFAGKMPWKVEWAAKWQAIGVTVEGAGKDHMSRGGSHDLTSLVAKRVLEYPVPYPVGYEFMLIGGKKMSSSKGRGYAAADLLQILPPELVRFLYVKMDIHKQTNFDPSDPETIPKLFDDYQKYAEAYYTKSDADMARVFELSQINGVMKPPAVRFSILAQWVQMPNMQARITDEGLEEWAKYARIWLDRFAAESDKFIIQERLPETAGVLSADQKSFLLTLAGDIQAGQDPEAFQTTLYNRIKEQGIPSKDAFAAIYTALLGKNHGPKAAWLIHSLDPEFVKQRFTDVATTYSSSGAKDNTISGGVEKSDTDSSPKSRTISLEMFSIASEVTERYPSISIGIATIKGVTIEKSHLDLEQEKAALLKHFSGLTTEQLGEYPEIQSYRMLYKAMGVDWHSRRPSPEALLRRVALGKGLYTINTCVDAYNLVVMQHRVSVGAFDLDSINFPTVLRFPKDNEEILLLGDTEPTRYKPTELAYFDQTGGYNIDFNYRDARRTAVQLETKNLYLNVDGVYDITPQQVEQTLQAACDLVMKYCGGTLEVFSILK